MRYVQDYAPSAYEALDDVDQASSLLEEARSLITTPESTGHVGNHPGGPGRIPRTGRTGRNSTLCGPRPRYFTHPFSSLPAWQRHWAAHRADCERQRDARCRSKPGNLRGIPEPVGPVDLGLCHRRDPGPDSGRPGAAQHHPAGGRAADRAPRLFARGRWMSPSPSSAATN